MDNNMRSSMDSWVDKYTPTTLSQLPVHHSKLKILREWITNSLSNKKYIAALGRYDIPPSVLALCGNSGCGKSTTVELLCQSMGITVQSWGSELWESDAVSKISRDLSKSIYFDSRVSSNKNHGDSVQVEELFRIEGVSRGAYQNHESLLNAFALHSRYPSLALNRKIFSNSNSTKIISRDTSSSQQFSPGNSWQSNQRGDSNDNFAIDANGDAIASDDSDDPSITTGIVIKNIKAREDKIVLLHDPPAFGQSDLQEAHKMFSFVLSFQCPVIIIVSNVSGRDDYTYAAEHCLPVSIRQQVQFQSVYFPPITELKMFKLLERIFKSEVERSPAEISTRKKRKLSDKGDNNALIQDIASQSLGDIRHAINQLQLVFTSAATANPFNNINQVDQHSSKAGGTRKPKRTIIIDSDSESDSKIAIRNREVAASRSIKNDIKSELNSISKLERCKRDVSFSSLHGVAKLVNARLDIQGRLMFDPDEVVARSELSMELLFSFVQFNILAHIIATQRLLPLAPRVSSPFLIMTNPFDEAGNATNTADSASDKEAIAMLELNEAQLAMDYCSEIDLYVGRKYDPAAFLDRNRGVGESFPDIYVSAILCRVGACCKGCGAHEMNVAAKEASSGHSASLFQAIRRPLVLNLRNDAIRTKGKVAEIHRELALCTIHTPDFHSLNASGNSATIFNSQRIAINASHSVPLMVPSRQELLLLCFPYYKIVRNARKRLQQYQHQTQPTILYTPYIDDLIMNFQNPNSGLQPKRSIISLEANVSTKDAKICTIEYTPDNGDDIEEIFD